MMIATSAPTRFARALLDYGLDRCSLAGSVLCVGLPPHPGYRRMAVLDLPAAPKRVCFMEAPLQADLIAALVGSAESALVEDLVIGTSHDYAGKRSVGYDMADAVGALSGAQMPALTRLSLGDMEMLFNGHKLFGTVGDVTHVLDAAANLETLEI